MSFGEYSVRVFVFGWMVRCRSFAGRDEAERQGGAGGTVAVEETSSYTPLLLHGTARHPERVDGEVRMRFRCKQILPLFCRMALTHAPADVSSGFLVIPARLAKASEIRFHYKTLKRQIFWKVNLYKKKQFTYLHFWGSLKLTAAELSLFNNDANFVIVRLQKCWKTDARMCFRLIFVSCSAQKGTSSTRQKLTLNVSVLSSW